MAFHEQIQAFIDIVLRYNCGSGLFGKCLAYYGMVEAQGHGSLHCHMLVWVGGNPNPNRLRSRMQEDGVFQSSVIRWLEDTIKCEIPGMTDILGMENDLRLSYNNDNDDFDPHVECPPQVEELDEQAFATEFQDFVR
ncbi:hypothetical protein M404DRAFT_28396 [Pisolithus tinctorius Marx 270]|uniref:Helitron helicase-like domain-containing protein n=1 Tax=Pisolithus tinctorius Marx 270 TaxID=870435 RepID=A0A0C3P339_PISTI|nr:hypothetical protein M404DRAFT_28396 [Pisolithus tinctorius Marx 270]